MCKSTVETNCDVEYMNRLSELPYPDVSDIQLVHGIEKIAQSGNVPITHTTNFESFLFNAGNMLQQSRGDTCALKHTVMPAAAKPISGEQSFHHTNDHPSSATN